MSLFILIWVILSALFEYALLVAPIDIKVMWKHALYQVALAPALLLNFAQSLLVEAGWLKPMKVWFTT